MADGKCWMAMRINSGSVRTPSLALSCVHVLVTVWKRCVKHAFRYSPGVVSHSPGVGAMLSH